MNAPCKGCENRHVACHSECGIYSTWLAETRKVNRQKFVYLQNTDYRDETRINKAVRRMKRSGDWETKNKYGLYLKGRR